MVLSQLDIKKAMQKGEIQFTPELEAQQWAEASVQPTVGISVHTTSRGSGITVSVASGIGSVGCVSGLWDEKVLKEADELGSKESYKLKPGKFVLALTASQSKYRAISSLASRGEALCLRMGLSMHQTAPWVQPGFSGLLFLRSPILAVSPSS